MCDNKVEQVVPKGPFDSKIIEMTCGSTSIWGTPLYCDECLKAGAEVKPAWQYEDSGELDSDPYYDPWNESW
jgi:hypothetical protein